MCDEPLCHRGMLWPRTCMACSDGPCRGGNLRPAGKLLIVSRFACLQAVAVVYITACGTPAAHEVARHVMFVDCCCLLLQSRHHWLLTVAAEGMMRLLQPLQYHHVYIPVMPYSLTDYLEVGDCSAVMNPTKRLCVHILHAYHQRKLQDGRRTRANGTRRLTIS
jgi:hypothetical protein